MKNKPTCLVTAPIATRSGYGAHSRDIVTSLIDMDIYNVQIIPVRWGACPQNALNEKDKRDKAIIDRLVDPQKITKQPEIHMHIVVPNEFQALGKFNIGITAGIETTVCRPEWIEGCNRMDMIIVPSNFSKEVFQNVSFQKMDERTKQPIGNLTITKPIEVLFEGADTEIYKKTNRFTPEIHTSLQSIKENFNFLFVGHWIQGGMGQDRKDVGMMIKTFLETFKNKPKQPGLILKTSGATSSILDRERLFHMIEEIKKTVNGDLPNIYLLHGDLTDEEMNDLYNHPKVKAHMSFTHGEGFGRPLLEASLSGKPVIASNWSGHIDFLHKLAVLLPGELTNVNKSSFPKEIYQEGAQWFTVNYQYASKVMSDVFKNYRNYTVNANKLSIVNQSKFSLKSMTNLFKKILDKGVPEISTEVKLTLPKLKKKKTDSSSKIKLPKLSDTKSEKSPVLDQERA